MKYVLNFVHNNPGEARCQSKFTDAKVLTRYGYNGQVYTHLNCAVDFSSFDPDLFPADCADRQWMLETRKRLHAEIDAAKQEGQFIFYHIDLFLLPKKLVEKYHDQLCDADGLISLDAPLTMTVHKVLFEELCAEFPEVDGFIIRVGETYAYDAPYHQGNGPIRAAEYDGSAETPEEEIRRYHKLIRFLRQEVCERLQKKIFFRTWDCYPDKFHADLDYYLAVTDAIEPHENLIFNIKHTALDFWRHVNSNPCIGQGKHKQVIEVQCQREYEGKGAHPDYVMQGVIEGFPEVAAPRGLAEMCQDERVCGIWGWARGGGWYGPYLQNEMWCEINAWVLGRWAADPTQSEEAVFEQFCTQELLLSAADAKTFREISLLSAQAVLLGHYCAVFDHTLEGKITPTNLWMRDDRIGGKMQLAPVLDWLYEHDAFDVALKEKEDSVAVWAQICKLSQSITSGSERTRAHIVTSCEYGKRLYEIVSCGWRVLAHERLGQLTQADFDAYAQATAHYQEMKDMPECATLYVGKYFALPGLPEVAGMDDSVQEIYRAFLQ